MSTPGSCIMTIHRPSLKVYVSFIADFRIIFVTGTVYISRLLFSAKRDVIFEKL